MDIIISNHLSAIRRMSLISSSSFGGFRRRNKWYHDSNWSTTSISSRDGSTTGTCLGCLRLWSATSPAIKSCKRNGKTRRMCRISAARTLAGAEELSSKCSKIVARYGVIGTRQSWTPRYLQFPKNNQENIKIMRNNQKYVKIVRNNQEYVNNTHFCPFWPSVFFSISRILADNFAAANPGLFRTSSTTSLIFWESLLKDAI